MKKKYNGVGHHKLEANIIPQSYLESCCYGDLGNKITDCIYYITSSCPNECLLAEKLAKGLDPRIKSGLERFESRYGEDWRQIAWSERR